jgi:hypothetical protein
MNIPQQAEGRHYATRPSIHSLAVNCMYSAAQGATRHQNKITYVGLTSMRFDQQVSVAGWQETPIMT